MARIARIVIPGIGHHITQRGVRSMNIFHNSDDKRFYINLLSKLSLKEGLDIHAYCLMDNHVHLLVVPQNHDSLKYAIGKTHKIYAKEINSRIDVKGHLFQERFFSCPLDEHHYIATARYIERNPVRAKMCHEAWDYEFSSAKFRTGLTTHDPLLTKTDWHYDHSKWKELLRVESNEIDRIRKATKTGRPSGSDDFITKLEQITGRVLKKKKTGTKK